MMHSPLASPRATRAVLQQHELLLKHSLGQNFLINNQVVARIGALAELDPRDIVLEVGPGIGTLSLGILGEGCTLVAIEADKSLPAVLNETCAAYAEHFSLVVGDALKFDLAALEPMPTKLVSNLPYQVAATVVLRAFEDVPQLSRAVVMVQSEVADRMAAQPGTKSYGAYTVKLALMARLTGRFEVAPTNFMPAPHVNSAVVRLERSELVLEHVHYELTKQVIDAAFAQRRKTIRNSMSSSGFDKAALDVAFAHARIDPTCRAETLGPEDFIRLSSALSNS